MTTFWLPCPPSVNGLYDGGRRSRRRFRSKAYRAWLGEAGWTLNAIPVDRRLPVPGRVEVIYEFARKHKRADVFNLEKATSDLLVKHRIIEDDSLVEVGTVRWVDDIPDGVRVTVEPFRAGINDP